MRVLVAVLLGVAVGWLLLRRRRKPTKPRTRWWVDGDKVYVEHSGPASGDWQTWTVPDDVTWAEWQGYVE